MNKVECLQFLLSNCKNRYLFQDNGFKKLFPDFYNDLLTIDFPDNFKFKQKLYHFLNDDPELKLGVCPVCGNRCTFLSIGQGYSRCCSKKCSYLDSERSNNIKNVYRNKSIDDYKKIKEKKEKTCLEKYGKKSYMETNEFRDKLEEYSLKTYGCKNPSQADEIKKKKEKTTEIHYGVKNPFQSEEVKNKIKKSNLERHECEFPMQSKEVQEKMKQTCLDRYDCENPFQSEEVKEKIKHTCLEKYGKEYYSQTDEFKQKYKDTEFVKSIKEKYEQTCLEKYNVKNYSQTDEYKEKSYKTKKKNKSFNTSKIETSLKKYFTDNNINFIYQYKSEVYPFNCDFYFPDMDLYVEIQGNWTHGTHPFTGSVEDLEHLEYWKSKVTPYYQNAIETWTVRDVHKRKIAKQNNLNYLEIFSSNLYECLEILLKENNI